MQRRVTWSSLAAATWEKRLAVHWALHDADVALREFLGAVVGGWERVIDSDRQPAQFQSLVVLLPDLVEGDTADVCTDQFDSYLADLDEAAAHDSPNRGRHGISLRGEPGTCQCRRRVAEEALLSLWRVKEVMFRTQRQSDFFTKRGETRLIMPPVVASWGERGISGRVPLQMGAQIELARVATDACTMRHLVGAVWDSLDEALVKTPAPNVLLDLPASQYPNRQLDYWFGRFTPNGAERAPLWKRPWLYVHARGELCRLLEIRGGGQAWVVMRHMRVGVRTMAGLRERLWIVEPRPLSLGETEDDKSDVIRARVVRPEEDVGHDAQFLADDCVALHEHWAVLVIDDERGGEFQLAVLETEPGACLFVRAARPRVQWAGQSLDECDSVQWQDEGARGFASWVYRAPVPDPEPVLLPRTPEVVLKDSTERIAGGISGDWHLGGEARGRPSPPP